MTAEDLKTRAIQFLPMPEELNAAEQLYYLTMRTLSAEWRDGIISSAQARTESAKALREFEKNNLNIRAWDKTRSLWGEIEQAAVAFAKERTMEAADDFYRTVYGFGIRHKILGKEQNENVPTERSNC